MTFSPRDGEHSPMPLLATHM